MANTFANHRPAPNDRCFGVEIECFLNGKGGDVPLYTVEGEIFFGRDGSIRTVDAGYVARELVTQPLEFEPMMAALTDLGDKWDQRTNATCGIHVHVGRGICSQIKATAIAQQLGALSPQQMRTLFGRGPSHYCNNTGRVGYHCSLMDHYGKGTTEFRVFSSGSFEWARECVRRVKVMCEMEEPRTYNNLKRAFGIVEEEGILRP